MHQKIHVHAHLLNCLLYHNKMRISMVALRLLSASILLLAACASAGRSKKILVYVLCYDTHSCSRGSQFFSKFNWSRMLRLPSTVYFESYAFVHEFPKLARTDSWDKYDYVGSLSWKAPIKFIHALHFGPLNMKSVLQRAPDDSDVIALVGQQNEVNLLSETTIAHPRFREVWDGLLGAFNRYSRRAISTVGMAPFYCNYWLARPQHLLRFMDFMRDAHGFMQNLTSIQDALWSDAKYYAKKNVSQAVFGLDYYAYHPFVLERLAPFFFNAEKLNIYVHKKFRIVRNVEGLTSLQLDALWDLALKSAVDPTYYKMNKRKYRSAVQGMSAKEGAWAIGNENYPDPVQT